MDKIKQLAMAAYSKAINGEAYEDIYNRSEILVKAGYSLLQPELSDEEFEKIKDALYPEFVEDEGALIPNTCDIKEVSIKDQLTDWLEAKKREVNESLIEEVLDYTIYNDIDEKLADFAVLSEVKMLSDKGVAVQTGEEITGRQILQHLADRLNTEEFPELKNEYCAWQYAKDKSYKGLIKDIKAEVRQIDEEWMLMVDITTNSNTYTMPARTLVLSLYKYCFVPDKYNVKKQSQEWLAQHDIESHYDVKCRYDDVDFSVIPSLNHILIEYATDYLRKKCVGRCCEIISSRSFVNAIYFVHELDNLLSPNPFEDGDSTITINYEHLAYDLIDKIRILTEEECSKVGEIRQ